MRSGGITRPSLPRERIAALFLFAAALLLPPLLVLFNVPVRVFGIPLLFLYLFGAWAVVIALAALIMESAGFEEDEARPPEAPEPSAGGE